MKGSVVDATPDERAETFTPLQLAANS